MSDNAKGRGCRCDGCGRMTLHFLSGCGDDAWQFVCEYCHYEESLCRGEFKCGFIDEEGNDIPKRLPKRRIIMAARENFELGCISRSTLKRIERALQA